MHFEVTPAQQEITARARGFAQEYLAPGVVERERNHGIGSDIMSKASSLGLLGVVVPKELGGLDAGAVAYALVLREIAAVDAAVAVTIAVTNMVAETVCRFGTIEQQRLFVEPLVRGQRFAGAFALSEPGAGSDAAALTTRATRSEGDYLLNGQKLWITSGDQAGVMVVWARTGEPRARGISCFLVERGTPGVSFGKPEEKMGLRASHTVPISFTDARVPGDRLLGDLDQGFRIAMTALDGGRISIGSQSVGMAATALNIATHHVQRQSQNAAGSGWHALGDMAAAIDASWLLTLRAAWRRENKLPCMREAAMAKVFASEAANRVIRAAIGVVGPEACLETMGLARLFRDCRITQVYEGTSEIQRLLISRCVLQGD